MVGTRSLIYEEGIGIEGAGGGDSLDVGAL